MCYSYFILSFILFHVPVCLGFKMLLSILMEIFWIKTYCSIAPLFVILIWAFLPLFVSIQELFTKLNRMASIAADMFVGRERYATLLLMRLTETVIIWLSEDQSFWDDIEEGPRPLGPLGLQQVFEIDPHWSASALFLSSS